MVTDAGMVTIPAGLAARLTVKPPAGAGADKTTFVVLVSVPAIVKVDGENDRVAVV
jgi:hypothetical protein